MSTTTTQEPSATATKSEADKPVESVVDAVFDVGEAWAAYGLKVGRMALITSARSLTHAARALDALAKSFEKKDDATHDKDVIDAPAS